MGVQSYVDQEIILSVAFTDRYADLATVGYTLRTLEGETVVPRTVLGVIDMGYGNYAVRHVFDAEFRGYIVWDTGTDPVRHAVEDIAVFGTASQGHGSIASALDEIRGILYTQDVRNVMRIPDDPVNPGRIRYVVKAPAAVDWSQPIADFTVPISYNERGVVQFGGEPTLNYPLGG